MRALENRVVGLNIRNVYNSIITFLDEELRTDNTRRAYKNDIEYFFLYMCKDINGINELTEGHLKFEYEDVLRYRGHLKRKYNGKATTINRKITSLKKLYKYLSKVKYNVDLLAFELEELPELNSEKINVIPPEIAIKMVDLAKGLPKEGMEKSLIIETLFYSSIRIDATLNLKWSDFRRVDHDKWLITTIDKQKEHRKPISDRLYQKLLENKKDDTNVFTIKDPKTINTAISELSGKMGIKEKYTCHSFKKSLINWELKENGDVRIAAKQGNHHVETMMEYYEEEFQDWDRYPSIAYEQEVDLSKLESLNGEELIGLIKKCSRKVQLELLSNLNR
jgi:integrase